MSDQPSPLTVRCPHCHAPVGVPCWTGDGSTHRKRRSAAKRAASPAQKKCRCTNHLGGPKVQHRSREAAVTWAVRRKTVRGMRLEPYRCPTSEKWHVRTARQRPEESK